MKNNLGKCHFGRRVIVFVNSLIVMVIVFATWQAFVREQSLFGQIGQEFGLSAFVTRNALILFVRGAVVASLFLGTSLEVKGVKGAWIINIGVPLALLIKVLSGVLLHSSAQDPSEAQQFFFVTAVPSGVVALLYALLYSIRRRADARKSMSAARGCGF